MATIIPKKLEKANTIYPDNEGRLYFRGANSINYYSILPNITVYGISPVIGKMMAERFNNYVMPRSPRQGLDLQYDLAQAKNSSRFFKNIKNYRTEITSDSIDARLKRGDLLGAQHAISNLKWAPEIGTMGCIGTVTGPYEDVFGKEYGYRSNGDLYNDTKNGKSPYDFVIRDASSIWAFSNKKDAKGQIVPEWANKIMIGDIISGMDTGINSKYSGGSGHARMVVDKGYKDGRFYITTREDFDGGYMPSDMTTTTWWFQDGLDNPFADHKVTQVYRPKKVLMDKWIRQHPKEFKEAENRFFNNKKTKRMKGAQY